MFIIERTMKRFFGIAALLMATLAFFSCDPAESGYKYEYYFDNIYTVNKHKVSPEFEDTLVTVSNIEQYGLETGQRARMVLRFYYDYSTMKTPKWEITELVEVIPTLPLKSKEDVDAAEYSTLITKLPIYDLMDRYLQPVWVWKNCQNINVSFKGLRDNAQFAMAVRGISGDSLELDLLAKAQQAGNVVSSRLLTFDLSNVADFLTEEEKKSIAGKDTLWTRIYFKREDNGAAREINILGGKLPNPVK